MSIACQRFSIQVSFLRDKLAYVHPCGSIRGPGDGRRLFAGRLLTKAVVLPQTMQSPSHYSAVFRREAANIHEHSLALPDYWEEEEEKRHSVFYPCASPSPRDVRGWCACSP